MSLTKCDACGRRPQGKYNGVYWNWWLIGMTKQKRYGKLCDECYATKVEVLRQVRDAEARLTCPSCGIDTEDDYRAIYASAFPVREEMQQFEWPLCEPCWNAYTTWIDAHSRHLEAVGWGLQSPQDSPSAGTVYADMGRFDPGVKHPTARLQLGATSGVRPDGSSPSAGQSLPK